MPNSWNIFVPGSSLRLLVCCRGALRESEGEVMGKGLVCLLLHTHTHISQRPPLHDLIHRRASLSGNKLNALGVGVVFSSKEGGEEGIIMYSLPLC